MFSRHTATVLKITEHGEFEQQRSLGQHNPSKGGRLKWGAIDAKFHPLECQKLVSCTTSGDLRVHDLRRDGRRCLNTHFCSGNFTKVHKVVWAPGGGAMATDCVLAAADDGVCYLWDTRCDGRLGINPQSPRFDGGKAFGLSPSLKPKNKSVRNVRVCPFNGRLS